MHHQDSTIYSICKALKIKKRDAQKALSLLIHFEIVGFNTYKEDVVKYFLKDKITDTVDSVVYLDYIERIYGVEGFCLGLETCIRKKVKVSDLPEKYIDVYKRMMKDGIIVEESLKENLKDTTGKEETEKVKKEKKEEQMRAEKIARLEKGKIRQKIINEIFENEIEKKFNTQTKTIFRIVSGFYPRAAPIMHIVQRAKHFSMDKNSGVMLDSSFYNESNESYIEYVVKVHLSYLAAFGAITESFERYQLNYSWIIERVKIDRMIDYYISEVGEGAGIVLGTLLDKKYIEDKFMQKHVLLEASDLKKTLFSLLEKEIVSIQMIPKTSECISSKSFHLWHVNTEVAISQTKIKVFNKINSCYLEISKCKEEEECSGGEEHKEKLDLLYAELEKLHQFHFILGL